MKLVSPIFWLWFPFSAPAVLFIPPYHGMNIGLCFEFRLSCAIDEWNSDVLLWLICGFQKNLKMVSTVPGEAYPVLLGELRWTGGTFYPPTQSLTWSSRGTAWTSHWVFSLPRRPLRCTARSAGRSPSTPACRVSLSMSQFNQTGSLGA